MIELVPPLYPQAFLPRAGIGLVLGTLVGGGGMWRGALTRDGALSAALMGTAVFTLGGWAWALLIIAFFVSSSFLSFHRSSQPTEPPEKRGRAGARRTLWQVLANGSWLTLLALVAFLRPSWRDQWLFPAAVGTLAAVTADTWGTELGLLSPVPPRLLLTGKVVPPGTNGGMTRLGTLASVTGGCFIGFLAGFFTVLGGARLQYSPAWLTFLGAIGGLGGALFDSLLGATVQGIRWCPTCEKETEEPVHHCSTATHPHRGWPWLDNEMVNFLASVVGSLIALLLALGIGVL